MLSPLPESRRRLPHGKSRRRTLDFGRSSRRSLPDPDELGLVFSRYTLEFLIGITFLQSPSLQPVSVALYSFQQGFSQNDSLISAAGIIMLLPMMGLFLVLQRHFIAGIASGGLGGG